MTTEMEHARDDTVETIILNNSAGFERDITRIDRDHAPRTRTRCEERENAGATSDVENDCALEQLRVREDEARVRARPHAVADHHRMYIWRVRQAAVPLWWKGAAPFCA